MDMTVQEAIEVIKEARQRKGLRIVSNNPFSDLYLYIDDKCVGKWGDTRELELEFTFWVRLVQAVNVIMDALGEI